MPGDIVGDMTSIGTLFAFVLVCIGVWVLRVRNPSAPRQFKTPLVPLVPTLGIVANGLMIFGLAGPTGCASAPGSPSAWSSTSPTGNFTRS